MHRIAINGLKLYGFHGVNPEEKTEGQPFVYDITIITPAQDFIGNDSIENTINYSQVIEVVKKINDSQKFDLLETLSQVVAHKIMDRFSRAEEVRVSVKKTQPPIAEDMDSVGVEYRVKRDAGTCRVMLSLGSNMGDSLRLMKQAVELISLYPGLKINKLSSVYRTQPMYERDQKDFLNMTAEVLVQKGVDPFEFLGFLKGVEFKLGRKEKKSRYGPRSIDIDIVWWDNVEINSPFLTLPHPGLKQRNFVLVPLMEIKPDFKIEGKPVGSYLEEKKFEEKVTRIENAKITL
ncbi:MAG: 2-amino-4-hydroxy-6-hydroxymethyldihydropteridine diphosphokinase [Actinomycetia bacterium]|nr:2-amino-4-hydroxy-6-hydroxymethyldihydropteridine diphosphokinase [Actinomycetes bacterium]